METDTSFLSSDEADNPAVMQIFFSSSDGEVEILSLPMENEGRYKLGKDPAVTLYVDVKDGEWLLQASGNVSLFSREAGGKKFYRRGALTDHRKLHAVLGETEYSVYSESANPGSGVFLNYRPLRDIITIGRQADRDIYYKNPLTSHAHAQLVKVGGNWTVQDSHSRNGTFLNGIPIRQQTELHLGDILMIAGMRIIVGVDFFSIGTANDEIAINSEALGKMLPVVGDAQRAVAGNELEPIKIYNRSPRRRTAFEPGEIVFEEPPFAMNDNRIPLMLRMGGSMVSGVRSAITGNIASLLGSLLFPLLTQKYTDKDRKEYEERRQKKYSEYLRKKQEEINGEIQYEQRVLNQNYPELSAVLRYTQGGDQLWERRSTDDDFLKLRLGVGALPMQARLDYPKEHFDMDQDALEQKMYALACAPQMLLNVPIMASLTENFVWGITGSAQSRFDFVRQLILRLAVLNSYDELKIIFLAEPEQIEQAEFLRFLPHLWDEQRQMRYLATTPSEVFQISEQLKGALGDSLSKKQELREIMKDRPYYVIFSLSKRLTDSMEILKSVMKQDASCGVSVIAAYDNLPKECSLLITLAEGKNAANRITFLRQPDQTEETFLLDPLSPQLMEAAVRRLANTGLRITSQSAALPKMLTFLEMFRVGRIEHLNPRKRWTENNPVGSLATPVGVSPDGSLFYLDLHQKYQGPHGLVAGMTGSGKSEFLLTYILSMAVNYHPDEVSFLLIDYKGGGLAGTFDDPQNGIHLPHLVGTITNLDGGTIQRSLVSIQSELKRRQRVFNEVKHLNDGSSMDIHKYQKMYRSGLVQEPMPHLFIISDEFAELKQQEPEFMDNLISIARIGRSLGVHLILATQKPSGVVNDQIRSNTKFRVCLKVQDRSDSMDMLKRPEAAELKDTGRFYLQVGYDEYFALGQSAWSGAEYEPQDEVPVHRDDSVQIIDMVGQTLAEAKPAAKKGAFVGSQIACVVKLLAETAEEMKISPKSLWKPALGNRIDLAALNGGAEPLPPYQLVLGTVDDPENQEQFPLIFDFAKCQNLLLVGQSGTGKTTFLKSVLQSFCERYSPRKFQFYALDYSGRTMKMFKPLPHCGAVLYEEDAELLGGFFDLINGIVAERKQLFTELGVESYEAACALRELPLIFVVIDNFSGLMATKFGANLSYQFQTFLKAGYAYGVKYLVSANHANDVSSRIRQEFGGRLCLSVKDKYEAGDVLECKINYLPDEKPGRGLCCVDGVPLEMQLAMLHPEVPEQERNALLRSRISELAESCPADFRAKGMPVVSEDASYADFASQFSSGRIPLGYSKNDGRCVALPLKQMSRFSIYFGDPRGVVPVTENFFLAAQRESMDILAVKRVKDSIFDGALGNAKGVQLVGCDAESLTELWQVVGNESTGRKAQIQAYLKEKNLDEKAADKAFSYLRSKTTAVLIWIENFADFAATLDMTAQTVFEKIFETIRYRNIYVVGCFEPNCSSAPMPSLYNTFPTVGSAMLFGGNYDGQKIVDLSSYQAGKDTRFNSCIMRYKGTLYPMLMPCGEIAAEETDPDDELIF